MDQHDQTALPSAFLLIREATAAKLGQHAEGRISFQILADADRRELFFRLTKNDGGGYFSREAVPLAAVRRCVEQHAPPATFRAAALAPAFQGRSINNRSFLAAVLAAEGLLQRDADAPHELLDGGNWEAWAKACRGTKGELPVIRLEPAAEPAAVAPAGPKEGAPTPKVGIAKGGSKKAAQKGRNARAKA